MGRGRFSVLGTEPRPTGSRRPFDPTGDSHGSQPSRRGESHFSFPFQREHGIRVSTSRMPTELHAASRGGIDSESSRLGEEKNRVHIRTCGGKSGSEALGFESPPPVLKGERGEPLWPEGIVGSITHSGSWAIAAAAVSSVAFSIRIDLENPDQIQTDDIAGLICRDAERKWAVEDGHYGKSFSHAFFSEGSSLEGPLPLCRRFIDIREVRLRWIPERQQFRGELQTGLNPTFTQGFEFDVGCKFSRELILTHMVLGC